MSHTGARPYLFTFILSFVGGFVLMMALPYAMDLRAQTNGGLSVQVTGPANVPWNGSNTPIDVKVTVTNSSSRNIDQTTAVVKAAGKSFAELYQPSYLCQRSSSDNKIVNCNLQTLKPNDTITFTARFWPYMASAGMTEQYTVTVSGQSNGQTVSVTNQNYQVQFVNPQDTGADVAASFGEFPESVEMGVPIKFYVNMSNNGPEFAKGAKLIITISTGQQNGVQPDSRCSAGTSIICNYGDNLGTSAQSELLVRFGGDTGNTAACGQNATVKLQAYSNTPDNVYGNNTVTKSILVTCKQATLKFKLVGPSTPVKIGDKMRMNLTVTNLGPGKVENMITSLAAAPYYAPGTIKLSATQPDSHCSMKPGGYFNCYESGFPALEEKQEFTIPIDFDVVSFSFAQGQTSGKAKMVSVVYGQFLGALNNTYGVWTDFTQSQTEVTITSEATSNSSSSSSFPGNGNTQQCPSDMACSKQLTGNSCSPANIKCGPGFTPVCGGGRPICGNAAADGRPECMGQCCSCVKNGSSNSSSSLGDAGNLSIDLLGTTPILSSMNHLFSLTLQVKNTGAYDVVNATIGIIQGSTDSQVPAKASVNQPYGCVKANDTGVNCKVSVKAGQTLKIAPIFVRPTTTCKITGGGVGGGGNVSNTTKSVITTCY